MQNNHNKFFLMLKRNSVNVHSNTTTARSAKVRTVWPYILGDFGNFFNCLANSPRVLRSIVLNILNECTLYCKIGKYSMWSLVRASQRFPWSATFPKMIKYFVEKKNTLNNERYRDLLISILSYDDVSAFLLWVKGRN